MIALLFIIIERLDIAVILDRLKGGVRHADLLALIHIRRALQHVQEGRQHFRRNDPVPDIISKTRNRAGLIMIA
ncbi:hypothetical protein D3C73_1563640 [compost metagenome]